MSLRLVQILLRPKWTAKVRYSSMSNTLLEFSGYLKGAVAAAASCRTSDAAWEHFLQEFHDSCV